MIAQPQVCTADTRYQIREALDLLLGEQGGLEELGIEIRAADAAIQELELQLRRVQRIVL